MSRSTLRMTDEQRLPGMLDGADAVQHLVADR
jgi:hypothetical protein